MESEYFCFGLAKHISVLMVFLQDRKEVNFFRDSGRIGLYCETELEGECCRAYEVQGPK